MHWPRQWVWESYRSKWLGMCECVCACGWNNTQRLCSDHADSLLNPRYTLQPHSSSRRPSGGSAPHGSAAKHRRGQGPRHYSERQIGHWNITQHPERGTCTQNMACSASSISLNGSGLGLISILADFLFFPWGPWVTAVIFHSRLRYFCVSPVCGAVSASRLASSVCGDLPSNDVKFFMLPLKKLCFSADKFSEVGQTKHSTSACCKAETFGDTRVLWSAERGCGKRRMLLLHRSAPSHWFTDVHKNPTAHFQEFVGVLTRQLNNRHCRHRLAPHTRRLNLSGLTVKAHKRKP